MVDSEHSPIIWHSKDTIGIFVVKNANCRGVQTEAETEKKHEHLRVQRPPQCFRRRLLDEDVRCRSSIAQNPKPLSSSINLQAMKLSAVTALLAVGLFVDGSLAFQSQSLSTQQRSTSLYGYVPSGLSKEQYEKIKAEEAKKKEKKNLGRVGPKGFQSRSFQSFQEALERGETTHLLPVWNAQARVKSGELKPEDIPYMQRGGECHRSFG